MKKILLIGLFIFGSCVFPSSALAAGGQLNDSCAILPCDTASGFTCNPFNQVCESNGINTDINVNTTGSLYSSSNTVTGSAGLLSGSACSPACVAGQTCDNGFCIANIQQSLNAPGNPSSGFVPLAPIPGLTTDTNGNYFTSTPSIPAFLNNVYLYLIGLAAALAVIYVIWGGLEISTQDSVSKQSNGRARIENALFGLLLVLAPYIVFYVINPAILNLSLNLPSLNTPAGTWAPTPVGPGQSLNQSSSFTGASIGDETCSNNLISSCGAALQTCADKSSFGSNTAHDYTCIKSDGTSDHSILQGSGQTAYCPPGDFAAVTCAQSMIMGP